MRVPASGSHREPPVHAQQAGTGTERDLYARYPVTDLKRKHVDFRAAEQRAKERRATMRKESRITKAN